MKRANWIGVPAYYNLNLACSVLVEAFGPSVYLVGSSIERRDYRDVDIRCILADDHYDRLFPGLSGNPQVDALWSLMCVSISEWLSARTGLPVDFQIQGQSEANEKHGGPRHMIGLFLDANRKPLGAE